jgi:hypothetical protein
MPDAFDALLAPLARLFLARGVVYSELAERLKGHYVKAAMAQSAVKSTDSRLSVITGLSRREVARLRAFETRAPKPNPLTRLVALWQTDTDYCDETGPKDLPGPCTFLRNACPSCSARRPPAHIARFTHGDRQR